MFRKRWVLGSGFRAGLGVGVAIVLGGTLAGCGGGGGSCSGAIAASWDFTQGSGGCFAGDQVVIRVDDNSMTVPFDCAAGGGVTPPVQGGVTHSVDLTLFDVNNTVVDQSPPLSIFVPCGQTAATPIFDFTD
jgi:hypothetical protein